MTSLDHAWSWLVCVGCVFTPNVIYHFVAFHSSCNVQSVAAIVLRVLDCHPLMNTRTSKLERKAHFLSLHVMRSGRQRIQLVSVSVFCSIALRMVKRSFSTGMRWEVLVEGMMSDANVACLIDGLLWIPYSSMVDVYKWTLTMANGLISYSMILLYSVLVSRSALPTEEVASVGL